MTREQLIEIAEKLDKCSECGYQVHRYNNTNFCPNCGMMANREDKYAKFNEACKLAKIDCDLH